MKKFWLIYCLITLLFSCDFSDNENDNSSLTLTINYSGDYDINSATYTFKSLTSDEIRTGSMVCNTETKTVSKELSLPSGYWDAQAQLVHNYDETSKANFAITTEKRQFYVSKSGANYRDLPDPFSSNYNGLQAEADVFEMINVGYTANSVRVGLFSLDSPDYYYFQLSEIAGSLRKGMFSTIKKGDYILWMGAENSDHPDWEDNPWHPGLTTTIPYEVIQFDGDDGFYQSINEYLQGWYFLDDGSWEGYDANFDDDLFYPHTDNGSVIIYSGGGAVQMTANDADNPATVSLEKLPVGENRFIIMDLLYNGPLPVEDSIPVYKVYLKKETQNNNTGIEAEFYKDHVIVRSKVEGVEKTYFNESYTIDPGVTMSIDLFLRDDVLRIYLNGDADSTFAVPIDPEIPENLFLHFETKRTTPIELNNLMVINNFDVPSVLNYP